MRVKMSKQPPPAPTASAVGSCPTVIHIIGRPGPGSLPSTIAPPDHPLKVVARTSSIYYHLIFKCDLDHQTTWTNVSNGTSTT